MNKTMLIAAALVLGGCSPSPYLSKHFGEAKLAAEQRQVINADPAAQELAPVDGQVTNATMDRYHSSYGKPQKPTNVFKIGVGTGK